MVPPPSCIGLAHIDTLESIADGAMGPDAGSASSIRGYVFGSLSC